MADCALVIGVSRYASLNDDLAGSVDDALRMTEWLLRPDGGKLRALDIRLLLSRRPADKTPAPKGVKEGVATKDAIVDALTDLSARKGPRLFVYFAGHGLTTYVNKLPVPVILASDFTWVHSDKSFTLESLIAFCASMPFPEQYFFIDACRDVRAPDGSRVYGVYPSAGSLVIPAPEQYGIHATSPGLEANQLQGYQRETGAFTSSLIEALEGKGSAKTLDDALFHSQDKIRYLITYQALLKSVVDVVTSRKLGASAADNALREKLIQTPRSLGEHSHNPEIVSFDVDDASKPRFMSTISIEVRPPAAVVQSVAITGTIATELRAAPWNTPPLPHGRYWIKATATGYVKAAPWPQVQLEGGPTTAIVALEPAAAPSGPAPTNGTVHALIDPPEVRIAGDLRATQVAVAVRAADPLAALELVAADGVRASGFGAITADVRPGYFTVVTVADDGTRRETALDVGGMQSEVDQSIDAPGLGDVTLHALASALPFGAPGTAGERELVDVAMARAALPQGILACTLGEASLAFEGRTPTSTWSGRASWRAVRCEPGAATVRISTTRGDFSLPVVVLADHVTSIVIAEAGDRYEVVMLWIPAKAPGPAEWRTAIIAQRALARGDLRWMSNALDASPDAADPVRALLRLARAILMGTPELVEQLAAQLSARWPQFVDGPLAAALAAGRPPDVADGVPVLRSLARCLEAGAVSRLVPWMMWTAFADTETLSDSGLQAATLDQLASHLAPAIAYLSPAVFGDLPPLPARDLAGIRSWLRDLSSRELRDFLDRLPVGADIVVSARRELTQRSAAPPLLEVAPSLTKREIPIVDRGDVWNELLALTTSSKRILLVTGNELTGKSHVRHLVQELCDRLTDHRMLYVDLDDQRSVERVLALGLAPQLDTAIELPENARDSTDLAWARAVAITVFHRIPAKLPGKTPWLVFDHFARMPISDQATTFFNTLIEQVSRQSPDAPNAMRLVLIDKREVPAEARIRTITREVRRVTADEIAAFVRSWRPGLAPFALTETVDRIVARLREASYMSDLGEQLAGLLEAR